MIIRKNLLSTVNTRYCFCMFQEDLLSHGDNLYDLVDPRDHALIQQQLQLPTLSNSEMTSGFFPQSQHTPDSLTQLLSEPSSQYTADPCQDRLFIARINASKTVRKVNRLADQKVKQ